MAPPIPFVGLTGAISSGKSTALAALARLGAATLSTDEVTHEILAAPETADRLAERWGDDVRLDGGGVNRTKVGEVVFGEPEELKWLESVLHPLVGERIVRWRAELPIETPLAVAEVPLLFEAGMDAVFDGTLVVVAGERRTEWLEARGDRSVEGRMGRQLTEDDKAARATWVVENHGSPADLEAKLRDLWPRMTQKDAP